MNSRCGALAVGCAMLAGPAGRVAAQDAGSGARPAVQAVGVETNLLVRVRAHDAKLIGDAVGGARVTVTDAATGQVLASGVTTGATGDTRLIMETARQRGAAVFDTPGAAGFKATFRLTRPTAVEIAATGPLHYPEALARASTTLLVEPGADIGGDGIVLDLQGLIVEVLDAAPAGDSGIAVRARVRLLCSCPTQPGGLWTIERVTARLLDGDAVVATAPLDYSGQTSMYAGTVRPPRPGAFTLLVSAADTDGVNYGQATRPVAAR